MGTYFLSPNYLKVVSEYMDYTIDADRKILLNIDEADQNKVLLSLTGRLYEIISDRANQVDFGKIPVTKGDVTKLDEYPRLIEVLNLLRDISVEYKEKDITLPIRTALDNLRTRSATFDRAYKLNIEFPQLVYETIYLAIINATSLMISSCIEYIKSPAEETFQIAIDKVGVAKTQERLLYDNLNSFNKSCASGQMDQVLEMVIKQNVKKLSGIDDLMVFGGGLLVLTLVFTIIPIMRELIYFFFYSRVSVSEFFEYQADLLTMNAYNLQYNSTLSPSEKKKIKAKQLAIAANFKKVSNAIAIDTKQAEVKAEKDVKEQKKDKMKLSDLKTDGFDSYEANNAEDKSSNSVLF